MPSNLKRIDAVAAEQRAALLRGEDAAVRRIARLYGDVEAALLEDLRKIEGALRSFAATGEEIPLGVLKRRADVSAMLTRARERLDGFAEDLSGEVAAQKARSAGLGEAHALALTKAELPLVARVTGSLRGLNEAAIREIAGGLSQGSPLRSLIGAIAPDGMLAIERVMVTGIGLGQNPLAIARRMRAEATGLSLRRSVLIARAESLRAYRGAQSATYAENPDVVTGMRIVEALDARTCALCWARHGTILEPGATMSQHPGCRGSLAPRTRYSAERRTGPERFAELSPDGQRRILGKGRYELYKEGMPLESVYYEDVHPLWGPTLKARTIEALG